MTFMFFALLVIIASAAVFSATALVGIYSRLGDILKVLDGTSSFVDITTVGDPPNTRRFLQVNRDGTT